jgi:hypothetical protein
MEKIYYEKRNCPSCGGRKPLRSFAKDKDGKYHELCMTCEGNRKMPKKSEIKIKREEERARARKYQKKYYKEKVKEILPKVKQYLKENDNEATNIKTLHKKLESEETIETFRNVFTQIIRGNLLQKKSIKGTYYFYLKDRDYIMPKGIKEETIKPPVSIKGIETKLFKRTTFNLLKMLLVDAYDIQIKGSEIIIKYEGKGKLVEDMSKIIEIGEHIEINKNIIKIKGE